jgi:HSP20 family protein
MNIIRREANPIATSTPPTGWDPWRAMRELMRWDPFQEMSSIAPVRGQAMAFVPDVDVEETKSAYVFKADVPGIAEKDIEVSLTGNRLTISGKREEEHREENANWFACERSSGSFARSFTLPSGTKLETAKAEMKNGVLTVTVPKAPEAQARRIAVAGSTEKAKSSS